MPAGYVPRSSACAMSPSERQTTDEGQPGPDEREPERRREPPPVGDHAAERLPDDEAEEQPDDVDAARPGPGTPCGTARWRTVCDTVPHTNAYAPNTTMITMATQPVVVSASARWVSTSSSRQTRMIVARGTCRSIVVVRARADAARRPRPRSSAGRSRPRPCPAGRASTGTSTDHAAPHVTLNARIDEGEGAHRRVADGSTAARRRCRGARGCPRGRATAPGGVAIRATSTRAEGDAQHLHDERPHGADGEQERARPAARRAGSS